MRVPLRLGTMEIPGRAIVRSGLRWLREDGQICRAGEVVAYCSIDVWSPKGKSAPPGPFSDERRDFQVAISTPVSGRLHHASGATRGGFFDSLTCSSGTRIASMKRSTLSSFSCVAAEPQYGLESIVSFCYCMEKKRIYVYTVCVHISAGCRQKENEVLNHDRGKRGYGG